MTEHSDDLLHIASCSTCRDRFAADNVVNFTGTRHREPERMREFLETARRLERERAGVEEVVADLLRLTPAAEWSSLIGAPELQNSAAVEQLIEEVRNRVERTPTDALMLADVATTIAESLPENSYPGIVLGQVRAMAWKERANTLRYLARYEEALDSIQTAEASISAFASASFDRAIVGMVKAMILHHTGKKSEATELLGECRRVFADHRDAKMLLYAGWIEGNFHYEEGQYKQAEDVYTELLRLARETGDRELVARIEHNLGFCATQFGDFRRANIHFSNGIAVFNDIGATLEAARSERGAGRTLIAKGQSSAGLAYLRNARTAFAKAGVIHEAALSGLEIVETLLKRGDRDGAHTLAREVADEISATELGEEVVVAMHRLETMFAEAADDLAIQVRNVHTLIQALQESASA
jgi:tetratricopeptide (TPR) repeat protein